MSDSNAYAALTIDRLSPARDIVAEARYVLMALLEAYPVHAGRFGDLPTRLAVLEGVLQDTRDAVAAAMTMAEYEDWRVRRDAS
jgi:hypothetical protein